MFHKINHIEGLREGEGEAEGVDINDGKNTFTHIHPHLPSF